MSVSYPYNYRDIYICCFCERRRRIRNAEIHAHEIHLREVEAMVSNYSPRDDV